ncbi:MAG: glutathione S-transferase N-terminal domain-containing protein [Solirubrobacteraceae bacterium]
MTVARDNPTLYVCHGDERAHGSPIPFLGKGSREELHAKTGTKKLPVLQLSDGTMLTPSSKILAWIDEHG